jgi:hypothetical protein
MKAQDFIAIETLRAMEDLIRQAKRVPADKLGWRPMDEGRSTLDQVAECAVICGFLPVILATFKGPEFDEASMKQFQESKSALDTLEKAEAVLRENTAKAVEAIRAVPDEKLDLEIPFFGPGTWKICSIMNAHAWNLHYHTGQICYIQTLLGDHAMG